MSEVLSNLLLMLDKGQDNALLRFSLGNEYFKLDNFTQAIEHLARAVELDPEYSAAWKLYGNALASNGQVENAIDAYNAGIEAATQRGDIQAAKEMKVFLKRLQKGSE